MIDRTDISPVNPTETHSKREAMIQHQIIARGVRQQRTIDAMRTVPREIFVPVDLVDNAYEDRALPVGPGQTISQPYIVAYMTAELDVHPNHKVLEIGTGTGYQTAILAQLAEQIYTVETDYGLTTLATKRLQSLEIQNVECQVGDGSVGWYDHAPYDRIMVTAACPHIPPQLIDQLKLGGIAILPVGSADMQTLLRLEKHESGTTEHTLIGCRFVKLVGEQGWEHP